jgi:signal transduction histidine kinase
MSRSLRGRLLILLFLLAVAALAAGALMVGLFHQSAAAQLGQADAENGRACDAIAAAYLFYSAGWHGPAPALDDATLHRNLTTVVQSALRNRPRVEGGIWQSEAGSLAYAFPSYEGAGPKTDLPQAELLRIRGTNATALADDRLASNRYEARSQTLVIAACPLPGPIPNLTAWTMTRVFTFAGRGYWQLMAGLGVLLATVVAAAVLVARVTMTWSRHVTQIEAALNAHDIAELPVLPATGERELDRLVLALNEAGRRLSVARQRADQLARQIATGERMAAIGRVAAGVAHEIRNPIAAMRLKAENALAGGAERQGQALSVILGQIERLDALLRRLLSVTERDEPNRQRVSLSPFLQSCASAHADVAAAKQVTLESKCDAEDALCDPDQLRRALDNLVLNAIQAAPIGSRILIAVTRESRALILSVHDEGAGPPPEIRDHLFEPFVTGRPDGTGLGLSIVREVAEAHGGTARFACASTGTTFEIVLPWPAS